MRVALLRCGLPGDARETNVTGTYPPLGLAYLAAQLREAGHDVAIHDGEAPLRSIGRLLDEVAPDTDLIGVTSTTLGWPVARACAVTIKKRFPMAPVLIGGPQVTAFPEETLRHSVFDLGVMGDGEWTLEEIVARLERGEDLTGIPGTVYWQDGEVVSNPNVCWMRDLDQLPMPALDLLPLDQYRSVIVRSPFVTMLASRGCPYRCAFCSQIYTGDKFRSHSPVRILDEMERAQREFGAREVVLFDETFGARKKDALEVCAGIRERGLTFRWNARTRIDLLDEALLRAMRDSGCWLLHLGIESGSQRVLDRMQKRITLRQIEEVVRTARRLGFSLHGYFMLGYPGESRREIEQTLAFSRHLPLDWASYTITIPNPRTLLQHEAETQGLLPQDFWSRYVAGKTDGTIPYLSSPECSVSYLERAKRAGYLRFYLRPGTLLKQSAAILSAGGIRRLADAGLLWLRELA